VPFTEFKSFRLERGLSLEARPRATTYVAVGRVHGKVERENTETSDFDRAERKARSWFSRLKGDHIPGSRGHVTMHEAAKSYLRHIRAGTPERTAKRRDYHQKKWDTISSFFQAVDVDALDTPLLKKFMHARHDVKPITLAKDFCTLRLIIRHSVEEGWRTSLPLFPRVGKLDSNPNPWFTHEQWQHLLDVAQKRVEDAMDEPGKHRHARMDIRNFIILQAATCMRVGELRSVRVRDVKIRRKSHIPSLDFEYATKRVSESPNEYLEIDLQQGKRGPRTVFTRLAMSGVETFRALVDRKKLKPADLLFQSFDARQDDGVNNSAAFKELLLAAGLRDHQGVTRNLKAVRCTGLMMWVLGDPNVNLKLLADNAGTSTAMLDTFYLKPLNVKMNRAALVG
jgi:integrase